MPCFNAYHALLSVEKSESELLDSLINRVDEHIRVIKPLSPASFTLNNLYDELAVMAIIQALPQSFDDVVRTISILDKFEKASVVQLLRNMDQTHNNLASTTSMITASSASPRLPQKPSSLSTPSYSAPTPSNSQNRGHNRPKCDFCTCSGHVELKCFVKEKLMRLMSQTLSPTAASATIAYQSIAQAIPEVPQSASITSASAYYSAATLNAHISSWIADIGASAHMTFNHHWMHNLMPHLIPI
jgi:hypothetical protein